MLTDISALFLLDSCDELAASLLNELPLSKLTSTVGVSLTHNGGSLKDLQSLRPDRLRLKVRNIHDWPCPVLAISSSTFRWHGLNTWLAYMVNMTGRWFHRVRPLSMVYKIRQK